MDKSKILGIDADNGDLVNGERPTGKICNAVSRFAKENPDIEIVLVGNEEYIQRNSENFPKPVRIINAPEYAPPNEDLRFPGKNSSLQMLADLANNGEVSSFFTIGDTGMFGRAMSKLRRLKGVRKPALVTPIPLYPQGEFILADVGATSLNQNGQEGKLYDDAMKEFALDIYCQGLISAVYAKERGISSPRIGLLTIGGEPYKGSDWIIEADNIFRQQAGNLKGFAEYAGKIEPKHALREAQVDVAVGDGHTMNIVLKTAESVMGVAHDIATDLKSHFKGWEKIALIPAYLVAKRNPLIQEIKARYDKDTYNAAILLGRRKAVSKGHGDSSERAIYFGLRRAVESSSLRLNGTLEDALERYMPKK